jgi:antitoxin component HigA of HigAB toxin-antitoxin module
MDATMILIDSEKELARARSLVDRLWNSNDPADIARLEAQARLIAAYEERKWPRRPPSIADLIRHLMDQHGLTRADMVPILGTPKQGQRSPARREGAEHGDGADCVPASACRPTCCYRRPRKRRPGVRANERRHDSSLGVVPPRSRPG